MNTVDPCESVDPCKPVDPCEYVDPFEPVDPCVPQLRGDCSSKFRKSNQNAKQQNWVDQFFGLKEESYETLECLQVSLIMGEEYHRSVG